MTGSFAGEDSAVIGVAMFMKRQSSDMGVPGGSLSPWMHTSPGAVALRTPAHGACATGGCQRSGPTGGATYGIL